MFRTGDTVDQYRLTDLLGSGAYGVVFSAVNTVSQQRVALKVVPLCGRAGKRELHALQTIHDLEHPHLLKLFHCGISGDYLYYTMELADGTLAAQHLTPAELCSAAVKIADALAFLHDKGFVHRDVKPDNLFWRDDEPLLGDLGLVTDGRGASLTGTPGFLPRDVRYEGAALSARSDLYALAKSFYCLLSGRSPGEYPRYDGALDPDAARLLQTVCRVCDGDGRIPSAAAFRDALCRESGKKAPSRRSFLWRTVLVAGVLLLTAGVVRRVLRPRAAKTEERLPQPGAAMTSGSSADEKMMREIRQFLSPQAAEKEAVSRQRSVRGELKKQAATEAQKRYPLQKTTTLKTMEMRRTLQHQLLQEALERRAAEDPAFRCFYVLYGELQQLAVTLQELHGRPEYAKLVKESYELWQAKYEAYCRERDRLLAP